jgi:molecular chaperone GrpE
MSDPQRPQDTPVPPAGPDAPVPDPSGPGASGAAPEAPDPGASAATPAEAPTDGTLPVDDETVDGTPDEQAPVGDEAAEEAASDADAASAAEAGAEAQAEPVAEEPDWKDRYVRSVAELDNVRKRARRDAAAGEARGIAKLAKQLLPALDNLDRALAHVDSGPAQPAEAAAGDAQLVEGLRIVHREIHAALSQAGIEAYDPTGEPFDPHAHEALTQQPAPEGTPPGTILAVFQAGYRRGDDVLRAAKVVVAG